VRGGQSIVLSCSCFPAVRHSIARSERAYNGGSIDGCCLHRSLRASNIDSVCVCVYILPISWFFNVSFATTLAVPISPSLGVLVA
jgi:hypothetical protein